MKNRHVTFLYRIFVSFLTGSTIIFSSFNSIAKANATLYRIDENVVVTNTDLSYSETTSPYIMATHQLETNGVTTIPSDKTIATVFRAPRVVLKPGFHAQSNASFLATGVRVLDVHFVNMVDPLDTDVTGGGSVFESLTQPLLNQICINEVEILNGRFVIETGDNPVRFRFKDALMWDASWSSTPEPLYECISPSTTPFQVCSSPRQHLNSSTVYDDSAINIIIFDNKNGTNNSYASRNLSVASPYILLDYNRIDENLAFIDTDSDGINDSLVANDNDNDGLSDEDPDRFSAEEHEMGHAFALQHTRQPFPTVGDYITNVMSTYVDITTIAEPIQTCVGTGGVGTRTEGFATTSLTSTVGPVCQQYYNSSDLEYLDHSCTNIQGQNCGTTANVEANIEQYSQAEIIMSFAENVIKLFGMD